MFLFKITVNDARFLTDFHNREFCAKIQNVHPFPWPGIVVYIYCSAVSQCLSGGSKAGVIKGLWWFLSAGCSLMSYHTLLH